MKTKTVSLLEFTNGGQPGYIDIRGRFIPEAPALPAHILAHQKAQDDGVFNPWTSKKENQKQSK